MKTYIVKGYTSDTCDFSDTIELPDNIDFERDFEVLAETLINSSRPSDYLDVFFDFNGYEKRDDLADHEAQIVLLGEAIGCENCQDSCGEWQEGCEDVPHGPFLITFEEV